MKQVLNKLIPHLYWLLVAIIIYLISMLVYVSIEFFQKSEPVKIADFGSILSGVSTLFTGLVALYVFSNWKTQNVKLFLKDEAKLLLSSTNNVISESINVGVILNENKILQYLEHIPGQTLNSLDPIEKFKNDVSKLLKDLDYFSDIANDMHLKKLIQNHRKNFKNYQVYFTTIQNNSRFPYGGNFKVEEEKKRNAINEISIVIKKRIVDYLLLEVD